MLSLYKDPKGTKVFSAHEAAMTVKVSTLPTVPPSLFYDEHETEGLKKRVKKLEDALEVYKVPIVVCT